MAMNDVNIEEVLQRFTYDPETGVVIRKAQPARTVLGRSGERNLGAVPEVDVTNQVITFISGSRATPNGSEQKATPRQIAFVLQTGRRPDRCLRLAHQELGLKWSNIEEAGKQIAKQAYTHLETIMVLGRERVLPVDCSVPRQPKSESSEMRQQGRCNDCGNQPTCLDREFLGKCLGEVSRECLTSRGQMMARAEKMITKLNLGV